MKSLTDLAYARFYELISFVCQKFYCDSPSRLVIQYIPRLLPRYLFLYQQEPATGPYF